MAQVDNQKTSIMEFQSNFEISVTKSTNSLNSIGARKISGYPFNNMNFINLGFGQSIINEQIGIYSSDSMCISTFTRLAYDFKEK